MPPDSHQAPLGARGFTPAAAAAEPASTSYHRRSSRRGPPPLGVPFIFTRLPRPPDGETCRCGLPKRSCNCSAQPTRSCSCGPALLPQQQQHSLPAGAGAGTGAGTGATRRRCRTWPEEPCCGCLGSPGCPCRMLPPRRSNVPSAAPGPRCIHCPPGSQPPPCARRGTLRGRRRRRWWQRRGPRSLPCWAPPPVSFGAGAAAVAEGPDGTASGRSCGHTRWGGRHADGRL